MSILVTAALLVRPARLANGRFVAMLLIVDLADQRAVGAYLLLCKGRIPAGAPEPLVELLLALPEDERVELGNAIRERAEASRRDLSLPRGARIEAFAV